MKYALDEVARKYQSRPGGRGATGHLLSKIGMSLLRLIHEIQEVDPLAEAANAPERPAVRIRWEGAGRAGGQEGHKSSGVCVWQDSAPLLHRARRTHAILAFSQITESVVDLVMLYGVVVQ